MSHSSISRTRKCLVQTALLLPMAVGIMGSAAAPTLSAAGALLCTISDGQNDRKSGRRLSCNFNAVAGGDRGYKGRIVLKGAAALPSGKHVVMWSVHAPDIDLDDNALVGRYRETQPGQLVGGKGGDIVLAPVTSNLRTHDATITTLELRLDQVEA